MTIPLYLLATHFVADFVLQSDWMAINKSKNWTALLTHAFVYSLCFIWLGLYFFLLTFIFHTITDAVTSRITSALWKQGKRHWFFVVIGLDQLIHYLTLAWTFDICGK